MTALDDVSETGSDEDESHNSNFDNDYLFESDKDSYFDEINDLPDLLKDYIDLEDNIFNGNLEELDDTSPDIAYTSFSSNKLAKPMAIKINLYDSGATHHMSRFQHKFLNYVEIKPVPITAANRRTF
ncbi:hypothetical protein BYT27DRAFT_7258823 [Phlegmacium glaucopus]|nr:hypothetical protein BYT27DRAFT_7258823 [Phlegmacium glaucopus]